MKGILTKIPQNAPWQNENGFTLVEMLLTFMIFCMLMAFFPLGMKTVMNDDLVAKQIQILEWEVFKSQIKKEIRVCDQIKVRRNQLSLQKNGNEILYEVYGTTIRRRVNLTGHEILLQNVDSLVFSRLPEGYSLLVSDLNGNEYHANIRAFIPIEFH